MKKEDKYSIVSSTVSFFVFSYIKRNRMCITKRYEASADRPITLVHSSQHKGYSCKVQSF